MDGYKEVVDIVTSGGTKYSVTFGKPLSFKRFKALSDAEAKLGKLDGDTALARIELLGEALAECVIEYTAENGRTVTVNTVDDFDDMRLIPAGFAFITAPLK